MMLVKSSSKSVEKKSAIVQKKMGAANGANTEHIYQTQLKDGYNEYFRNSDVAEALGERAGDVAANLEASGIGNLWPWGHDYAIRAIELKGSI